MQTPEADLSMPKVASRTFRDKLTSYLHSPVPIAVTCRGQTVGFYVPTRPDQNVANRAAMESALAMRRHRNPMSLNGSSEDSAARIRNRISWNVCVP
jgi:hypothetical protein